MLKVAHILNSYLSQSETFIWQYLSAFKSIKPIVITNSTQNLEQFPLTNGRIILKKGKRYSKLWFLDNFFRRILKDPYGLEKRIIAKNDIDVIHAHFGPVGCKILPIAAKLNLPLLTTFYGYDLSISDIVERHFTEYQQLFKYGSAFLVEGPHMRVRLKAYGCPDTKIHVQRIAINIDNYHLAKRKVRKNSRVNFLFVGRFIEKKGLEYALRALSNIRNENICDFQIRIIGFGVLENYLKNMVNDLNLEENVVWLGMKAHTEVLKELRSCDIFIHPSVTARNGDSEGGAPTIILEAQANKIPVISSFHADIPYIAINRKAALLANERDVEGLTDNIRYLLKRPETWKTMGSYGRSHIEKYHNVTKEVSKLEMTYKRCSELYKGNSKRTT